MDARDLRPRVQKKSLIVLSKIVEIGSVFDILQEKHDSRDSAYGGGHGCVRR